LKYLKAAIHIPIIDGLIPEIVDNEIVLDGMFTDPHPQLCESCLKITWDKKCSCGCYINIDHTIKADIDIPFQWCIFPPDADTLKLLYLHGYYQAKLFFHKKTKEEFTEKEIMQSQIIQEQLQHKCLHTWDYFYMCKNILYLIKGVVIYVICFLISQTVMNNLQYHRYIK
jgi:hypothetical protein